MPAPGACLGFVREGWINDGRPSSASRPAIDGEMPFKDSNQRRSRRFTRIKINWSSSMTVLATDKIALPSTKAIVAEPSAPSLDDVTLVSGNHRWPACATKVLARVRATEPVTVSNVPMAGGNQHLPNQAAALTSQLLLCRGKPAKHMTFAFYWFSPARRLTHFFGVAPSEQLKNRVGTSANLPKSYPIFLPIGNKRPGLSSNLKLLPARN